MVAGTRTGEVATISETPPEGMSKRMWDTPEMRLVSRVETYPAKAEGPVRRAALRDEPGGRLLGHVWTDDRQAGGFLEVESAGRAGLRAFSYVWAVQRRAYEAGRPASDLLDPALYAPMYHLDNS